MAVMGVQVVVTPWVSPRPPAPGVTRGCPHVPPAPGVTRGCPQQAVMGVQVVVTLLAASLMQKMAPHCSFARWLLCNGSLYRYKHPSDEELCALAGKQRPKSKRDRRANGVAEDKPLSVPRDIELQLDTSPITAVDALVLRYFLEYQWFVDFSVYAGAVYAFSEGYSCLVSPAREGNLGVLCKVFFMVMRHYFRSEEGGERSVCLTSAFFFLLLAMLALVVREDYLEFGLEAGLAGVSSNLEPILKPRGWEWTLPLARLAFKLGLVALCSFLGACLTFPGLRLAQTHLDALSMAADKPLTQVLLHLGFVAPVLVVLLWVRPLARDFLLQAPLGKQTVQILSDASFDTLRLWAIVALSLLRLLGTRHHLQAYLGLAERWVRRMRREAGRIPAREIQQQISRIYCYVSVVSLQYLGPVILTLHCALLLKTLGHHSWGLYPESPAVSPAAPVAPPRPEGDGDRDVQVVVQEISGLLGSIFTPPFFRGLFSFLTWWVATCQVVTSLFGLYFHQYLAAS
ncbi:transmembrane protein 161A isoform X3 [Haemorhous mexicanus]|uniref:transmembrane protein 161A isoform X3 n=1 Tax=Haemorhous mexicanus TaxID=30427 RepID=UPI0028BE2B92|nr:transmembrane protein 161A isoform X3 [Haemorhous mexicanus]